MAASRPSNDMISLGAKPNAVHTNFIAKKTLKPAVDKLPNRTRMFDHRVVLLGGPGIS
ncbi:hypothetical protein M404DRAFT_1005465 [Pisolithus tinctorius Marx 270]|uniref:Uncharacterized protein n=1 Tax=Pisolithus tinctorius Marx 270 TaxID=870435 RepID=A0A0C3NS74_PISTI|nr:hypothetical protein M404DRAFT_1005465 [Pisolithus tinctorius Marx 270]